MLDFNGLGGGTDNFFSLIGFFWVFAHFELIILLEFLMKQKNNMNIDIFYE